MLGLIVRARNEGRVVALPHTKSGVQFLVPSKQTNNQRKKARNEVRILDYVSKGEEIK